MSFSCDHVAKAAIGRTEFLNGVNRFGFVMSEIGPLCTQLQKLKLPVEIDAMRQTQKSVQQK